MSREIKFRAWDMSDPGNNKMRTLDVSSGFSSVWLREDSVTKVMQFTGLHDKNGKEIYEGDILLCIAGSRSYCYTEQGDMKIVEFDTETSGFEPFCDYDGDCGYYNSADYFIVIGNIHENKEFKTLGYIYGFEPQPMEQQT